MSEAFGFREFGGPETHVFFDRPDPVPGPAEVLIRVTAAGVNPSDYKLRAGMAPALYEGRPFPQVLGGEAAGVVLDVGADVEGLAVGDSVFGSALTGAGTYADTTVLHGSYTARKPEGLRDDWAAAIPVAVTTALDAVDQLDLPRGATVLISGVGGGVGLVTAQVARDRGLRVIGTGSTAKRNAAEALGVTFVDYTSGDVPAQMRTLVPGGVDGVVDLVGGPSLRTLAPLATHREKVVSAADPTVADLGGAMVIRRADRADLERAADLLVEGRIDPHITSYPFAQAAEALALVEGGHALGKVVIDMTTAAA
ncbi:NADP-dependent oxidoreductase [Streptomyces subrutilus]|uniref:NADP-dependent oxidoreductase n=2 Tax=Streptomyces subrutilus TaxID=36818 RepID=A0A5P2US00_9ACTN|nr:NADP-dependent oxidoreductase [Streptomyces subrutilus]QEU81928.1 NADP-dependent oxidoreductase [Streptomyces subrutilus]WSJ28624.1 NADP-dependent oxidoreductase [Streptomyces subrutilus]GGZ71898.1 NADPH:quinone reductase [Streptomyces subrutilus]